MMLRLNSPRRHAKMDAPTAPTAADSVGVAMPARIDPKTINIKMKGGTIADSNSGGLPYPLNFFEP